MSAQRTATPLMASTLALAAGVAAILVGCSRHTPASADNQQVAASSATAYDPNTGKTVPVSATPGSLRVGDASSGPAGDNTVNGAAGGTSLAAETGPVPVLGGANPQDAS